MLKISWRNIWRNRLRSLVIIAAIAIGLLAGVFASAFVNGMMAQKVESVIELEMSHFQVHHPKFRDKMESSYRLQNGAELMAEIGQNDSVQALTGRVITMGTVNSARSTGMLRISGIDPAEEAAVTGLDARVVEGDYLPQEHNKRSLPILISTELAEKYRVKLRSKLIFKVMDVDNNIRDAAFKVVGLYDSGNGMYDKMNVFVRKDHLQNLLGMQPQAVHEIAVLLTNHEFAEPVAETYANAHPDLEVLPWMDLALGMRYMIEAMGVYTYVIVSIILVALLFSIINTMLMAVLDRIREFGMLMAIGMSRGQVFVMIVLETIMLSMIGGPLGLLLAYSLISVFATKGINLAGAAYDEMGFASIIYPSLDPAAYFNITIMVLAMAFLASLYPAIKALRLNPVEAIRKI